MKVLIIGYGSIGKRHFEVLNSFNNISQIDLVTKQNIPTVTCYKSIESVANLDIYDYFVIASETNKHYEQLIFLEKTLRNKIIFCEKPLFDSYKSLVISNNAVYVGYVLRFHPLLQKLKYFLENETIISINAKCGQYLPTWRPNTDYRECYSAKKELGGGVLLDLSHEIDYIQWLAGELEDIKSYQLKISDLEINSDDITTLIGITKDKSLVNMSIDYISKITHRCITVDTNHNTYMLDFINNELLKKDKNGLEERYCFSNLQRNYMFEKMHNDILSNGYDACNFDQGLEVMKVISNIQEQNR
jgi:predicted dehydrogenase